MFDPAVSIFYWLLAAMWLVILALYYIKLRQLKIAHAKARISEHALTLSEAAANTGHWIWRPNTQEVIWSKQCYEIFGRDPDTWLPTGENFRADMPTEDRDLLEDANARGFKTGEPFSVEYRYYRGGQRNRTCWVLVSCNFVKDKSNKISEMVGIVQDITERKQAEETIRQMAMTDQLTGLANRRAFDQRIRQSIRLAEREGKFLALVSLDLNKFKTVNDTYGHPIGDAVLRHVASILNKYSRDTDIVARTGGDEFQFLVVHPEGKEGVGQSAQRIIDEINTPMHIKDHKINIGVSIGIALYPEDANTENELMTKSDLALYEVKKQGRVNFLFYESGMNT